MGLFERKSKDEKQDKNVAPEPWEYAKEISAQEAARAKELPIGWYIFQENGKWYGLKPDTLRGGLVKSDYQYYPHRLASWLGVPVKQAEPEKDKGIDAVIGKAATQSEPDERAAWEMPKPKRSEPSREGVPDYLKRMGLVEEKPEDVPPTDIENRWAEEKLTEELKDIEDEIQEAAALLVASQQPAKEEDTENKSRKKRKSLGRTNKIMTRLTDSELVNFKRRLNKSGMAQGDFIREAILNNQIVVEERSFADVAILDELALLRAELGRQGGLLKMITKPNLGQRELKPAEWEQLMGAIRGLDSMKEKVSKLEEKVSGNSKASIK